MTNVDLYAYNATGEKHIIFVPFSMKCLAV